MSKFDETRVNITVEGCDLAVNKGDFDRQTHTYHMLSEQNALTNCSEFLFGFSNST